MCVKDNICWGDLEREARLGEEREREEVGTRKRGRQDWDQEKG